MRSLILSFGSKFKTNVRFDLLKKKSIFCCFQKKNYQKLV